jgi:hypothetical protein
MKEIKYQANWGRLYILLGVLFGLLFVIGALILEDFTIFLNILASFMVIYIGYAMLKKPYAGYNKNEIKVFTFLGATRHHYKITADNPIQIENNRLYMGGKKLKLNSWMIDAKDWDRLKIFYDQDASLLNELKG